MKFDRPQRTSFTVAWDRGSLFIELNNEKMARIYDVSDPEAVYNAVCEKLAELDERLAERAALLDAWRDGDEAAYKVAQEIKYQIQNTLNTLIQTFNQEA